MVAWRLNTPNPNSVLHWGSRWAVVCVDRVYRPGGLAFTIPTPQRVAKLAREAAEAGERARLAADEAAIAAAEAEVAQAQVHTLRERP
jgi:hypothetical protein